MDLYIRATCPERREVPAEQCIDPSIARSDICIGLICAGDKHADHTGFNFFDLIRIAEFVSPCVEKEGVDRTPTNGERQCQDPCARYPSPGSHLRPFLE